MGFASGLNCIPERGLPLHWIWNIVFMDNYLLKPSTVGIAAVGTVCSNRRGLPIELKEKVLRNQGDTYVMHTGPLSATKYLDKKPVYLLSTLYTS